MLRSRRLEPVVLKKQLTCRCQRYVRSVTHRGILNQGHFRSIPPALAIVVNSSCRPSDKLATHCALTYNSLCPGTETHGRVGRETRDISRPRGPHAQACDTTRVEKDGERAENDGGVTNESGHRWWKVGPGGGW
jgi:hypothetical protein